MLLAIDYDKTYNAAPRFFDDIISLAQDHGHEVKIVTLRSEKLDWHEDFEQFEADGIEVVFCDGEAKLDVCHRKNIVVDWWLDDWPQGITMGSNLTPTELTLWRAEQGK